MKLDSVPDEDSLEAGEIVESLLQVGNPVRLSANIGVNAYGHHFHAFEALFIQLIESLIQAREPIIALMLMDHHHGDVVMLDRIGQSDQRAMRSGNPGWFVVIDPVADVAEAGGSQIIRRFKRLGKSRPQPADRTFPVKLSMTSSDRRIIAG